MGEFERQPGACYHACVLNTKVARTSDYKPKIEPQELSRRAKAGCRGDADFDTAREEVLYYAEAHLAPGDASIEELLALAVRTGSAVQERQSDCLHSGLGAEELRKCLLGTAER